MVDRMTAFVEVQQVRLCLSCLHASPPSARACCPEREHVRVYITIPKDGSDD